MPGVTCYGPQNPAGSRRSSLGPPYARRTARRLRTTDTTADESTTSSGEYKGSMAALTPLERWSRLLESRLVRSDTSGDTDLYRSP